MGGGFGRGEQFCVGYTGQWKQILSAEKALGICQSLLGLTERFQKAMAIGIVAIVAEDQFAPVTAVQQMLICPGYSKRNLRAMAARDCLPSASWRN